MTSAGQRIFVSHSHLDNEFGTKLAQDLHRVLDEDSAVFYDVMGGLHGGETWWEKIIEELTLRDVFLLVLSPDAMNSRWVRLEINMALDQNKFILPILHRTCAIRADLKTIQNISFLAPKLYEAAFREVLLALHLPSDIPIAPEKPKIQHNDPAAVLIQRLETAFTEQDWPDVIRKADYLMKHMPESMTSLVYRWHGVALLEEGKEQQAQEAFEIALALVSDRQERLTLLSDYTALLVRQKQWTEVLQRAREALRLVPHNPAWLAMQQQAQDQLALQVSPMPPSQKQEQTKEKESASAPQNTRDQWFDESNSFRDLNRYEEALTAYEQAIRLDPNDAAAHINKGNALRNLKRYKEALSAYDQAIRLNPNYAAAYYNKGVTLRSLKRNEEAVSAYEQAIRLDPKKTDAYLGKGNALYDLKRHEEALRAYEQAIRLNPNDALAYYGIGIALEQLGKRGEAQNAYAKARQLGYSG